LIFRMIRRLREHPVFFAQIHHSFCSSCQLRSSVHHASTPSCCVHGSTQHRCLVMEDVSRLIPNYSGQMGNTARANLFYGRFETPRSEWEQTPVPRAAARDLRASCAAIGVRVPGGSHLPPTFMSVGTSTDERRDGVREGGLCRSRATWDRTTGRRGRRRASA
jgi:hypothetical protein